MRLGARIVLFIVFSSVVPLVLIALATARVARDQVESTIVRSQVAVAESVAGEIARQLDDTQRVLRLQLGNFRLDDAPPDVRSAFVLSTYRLFPEISVAMLRGADGGDLVPPVYQSTDAPNEIAGHDAVSRERLARLRAALPAAGSAGDVTAGPAYLPDAGRMGVIPMTVASPWGDGLSLGVELSLSSLGSRLAVLGGGERDIAVLDANGTVLVRGGGRSGLVEPGHFRAFLDTGSTSLQYTTGDGAGVVAACTRVPTWGWQVAVAEPVSAVTDATWQIRARTAYIGGVALLFAAVAGFLLSRAITVPILTMRDAALAVGGGDFRRRVDEGAGGELADLAKAFNRMSQSLQTNAQIIAAKNAEIEAFNRELQERVEQRTAQLQEAQSRLVQSGQLAAVAELSAGLAHELNNPLAGILGLIQLTAPRLAGRPEESFLRAAEKEALRCKEIVANLLRFTRPAPAAGAAGVVDMKRVLQDVLLLVGGPFRQRDVTVEHVEQPEPMLVRGDATLLGRALGQLLTSLRSVAAPGSVLRIRGSRSGADVVYRFELGATTGHDDDWRAAGMGFWVARQVFAEHAATLREPEGERGGPRAWTLIAPAADAADLRGAS
jgi:signal transduction histidine kinase